MTKGCRLWFFAILALSLLLRYPVAGIPLERDEGEYAYIGQRWLRGEVPYKESFDQKPPGTFLVYAAILRFIGTSPEAIHWGAQLYTLGTLALLFLLGRKLFSPEAGLIAAALCASLVVDHSLLGNAANTELFAILPMTAAMYTALLAAEGRSGLWSLATGLLGATAIMFKQVTLLPVLFSCFLIVRRPERRLLPAAGVAAGMGLVLTVVFGYFVLAGAWWEFYDCTIAHNLYYSAKTPLSQYPSNFWLTFRGLLISFWPVFLFAFIGTLPAVFSGREPDFAARRRRKRKETEGALSPQLRENVHQVAGWLVFCFLAASVGGYFRHHYYHLIVPPLALLAAWGITQTVKRPSSAGPRRALQVILPAGIILYAMAAAPWYYSTGSPAEKSRRLYGYNPFPESPAVGRYLDERSDPKDSVFIFGSEPQILYYAERKSASRYIFVYPLMTPFEDTLERQRGVLAELEKNDPRLVVTVFVPTSFLKSPQTPDEIFSSLQRRLQTSYQIAGLVPVPSGQWSGSLKLVTGAEARRIWEAAPIWYDTSLWALLAVWEKK